jgi:LCP family protein required for cell wall assembly
MRSHKKTKNWKKGALVILAIIIVALGILGVRLWKYLSIGVQVVTSDKIELKQDEEKRVNMLILGVGGGAHEGPDLTDTIIFASIDPKLKEVLLVSIPRDLWVPELTSKINTAYFYGENKREGGGLLLAKAIAGKVLGQEIEYAIKIDFEGFVKAIDKIGGLNVNVDRGFDDYAYPITGSEDDACGFDEIQIASFSAQIATGSATESEFFPCRYEHLHFDQGHTAMDGLTALKFVRSRHSLGPEGSDFARSKRQEKIISAFKDKIISLDLLLNPAAVLEFIEVVRDSINMDIKEEEYDDFIRLAQKFKEAKITSAVLDSGDYSQERQGLLMAAPTRGDYGGQWVLIPVAGNGNYSEIKKYIDCQIDKTKCPKKPSPVLSQ